MLPWPRRNSSSHLCSVTEAAPLTEITELTTALGMLVADLTAGMSTRPPALRNVDDATWERLVTSFHSGEHRAHFVSAFENGAAFLHANDALREREPRRVEWKGPHRAPGEDLIPTDIRIDHVYQVSCKYDSRIMANSGPARLFDRLLADKTRTRTDWFHAVAPDEHQAFYAAARARVGHALPDSVTDLTATDRQILRNSLRPRRLPEPMQEPWTTLCEAVASRSSARWRAQLTSANAKLRMLWRLLRVGDAPYFLLGTDGSTPLRLRVASAWDWAQEYELRSFDVAPRPAGQPEVAWNAVTRHRATGHEIQAEGLVEIRWSHGRFSGAPEAKIKLTTPLEETPGYFALT